MGTQSLIPMSTWHARKSSCQQQQDLQFHDFWLVARMLCLSHLCFPRMAKFRLMRDIFHRQGSDSQNIAEETWLWQKLPPIFLFIYDLCRIRNITWRNVAQNVHSSDVGVVFQMISWDMNWRYCSSWEGQAHVNYFSDSAHYLKPSLLYNREIVLH